MITVTRFGAPRLAAHCLSRKMTYTNRTWSYKAPLVHQKNVWR